MIGSARDEAPLVTLEGRGLARRIEKVPRIEGRVLQELIHRAVVVVGAPLRDDLQLGAGVAPELRRKASRNQLDLLDRIQAEGICPRGARHGDVRRDGIVNRDVVGAASLAVGVVTSRQQEGIVAADRHDARSKRRQGHRIAVQRRDILDGRGIQRCRHLGASHIQVGSGAGCDGYALIHGTDLQARHWPRRLRRCEPSTVVTNARKPCFSTRTS